MGMIYLGADKHGFKAIKITEQWLKRKGLKFENVGVLNEKADIKLQKLLPKVAVKVKSNEENRAIISCGTGIGVEVGINKFEGIRAVLAYDPEIAAWSRIYDKCNVLCLVGWKENQDLIEKILEKWFTAEYDGDQGRLEMFNAFDSWH